MDSNYRGTHIGNELLTFYVLLSVKAGGMRIVQHKHEKADSSQSREEKQEQAEEFGTV